MLLVPNPIPAFVCKLGIGLGVTDMATTNSMDIVCGQGHDIAHYNVLLQKTNS